MEQKEEITNWELKKNLFINTKNNMNNLKRQISSGVQTKPTDGQALDNYSVVLVWG